MSSEETKVGSADSIEELRTEFQKLEGTIVRILPKVDSALIFDFLNLEKAADGEPLPYTLEVYTNEGVNTDVAKAYIFEKTGMMPAISENGTHYTTNQILTLEMLKEMSDSDDVVEITGNYTGGIAWHSLRHTEVH